MGYALSSFPLSPFQKLVPYFIFIFNSFLFGKKFQHSTAQLERLSNKSVCQINIELFVLNILYFFFLFTLSSCLVFGPVLVCVLVCLCRTRRSFLGLCDLVNIQNRWLEVGRYIGPIMDKVDIYERVVDCRVQWPCRLVIFFLREIFLAAAAVGRRGRSRYLSVCRRLRPRHVASLSHSIIHTS